MSVRVRSVADIRIGASASEIVGRSAGPIFGTQKDLQAGGHDVVVSTECETVERRSAGASVHITGASALAVYLAGKYEDRMLDALLSEISVILHSRFRGSPKRVIAIYGEDDRTILREVEVGDADQASAVD